MNKIENAPSQHSSTPTSRFFEVSAALIFHHGKLLITQRHAKSHLGGLWEFPGGKRESNETFEQCLVRELREELSIEIQSIECIQTQASYYEDGGIFNVAYCFISGYTGEPKNNVFEQIRWVTVDELKCMDMLEGNKPFIAKLAP